MTVTKYGTGIEAKINVAWIKISPNSGRSPDNSGINPLTSKAAIKPAREKETILPPIIRVIWKSLLIELLTVLLQTPAHSP